jgi:hypothetical protein
MAIPTSSHPKIVVSEYNRTSTDSMRRTNSEDSRRTSVSSSTHQHDHHNHNSHSQPHHADQENEESHHPGTRIHESEMHEGYEQDDTTEALETVTSMEQERRNRKRDYALQLSRTMGKQLVAGISKGSRAEAKERVRRSERERTGLV